MTRTSGLWWLGEPDRLNKTAIDSIADPGSDVFISAASAWQIAIKHALGRLVLEDEPTADAVLPEYDVSVIVAA